MLSSSMETCQLDVIIKNNKMYSVVWKVTFDNLLMRIKKK